jgi:hypothetical protein
MSKSVQSTGEVTSQLQLKALEKQIGDLKGLKGWVAKKILSSGFIEKIRKVLSGNTANIKDALKTSVNVAVQQAASAVAWKLTLILSIIAGIFILPVAVIMLTTGGNIVIPIVVFIILVVIICFVIHNTFKMIARRISKTIFNAIESKIS